MKCEYCGKEFTSKAKTARFCCDNCRLKAFRDRQKAGRKKAEARENQREKFHMKQQQRESEKQFETDRREKAAAGDPFARLTLARPYSLEYWEAFRDYQEEQGCECFVNGINTQEENFPEKVLETVRELGTIRIAR